MNAVATYLDDAFTESPSLEGRIHSCFEHAVNVEFSIGAEQVLYTFAAELDAGIPDSIVLSPANLERVRQMECGAPALKDGNAIMFPQAGLAVELGGRNCSNTFPLGCRLASRQERQSRMDSICGSAFQGREREGFAFLAALGVEPESALQLHAAKLFKSLERGLEKHDLDECEQVLRSLIGLGGGLTPSADDVLLGMMAAFRFRKEAKSINETRCEFIDAFSSAIVRLADKRTTDVSRKYLRCAGQGRFSLPLLKSAMSFLDGGRAVDMRAVKRLAGAGRTSGIDMLAGLALGIARMD